MLAGIERGYRGDVMTLANDLSSRARRVLVSGSTGLIGRRIVAERRAAGDIVVPLVRGDALDGVRWNPGAGTLDPAAVSGFDVVIHLAGEPVLGRWTADKKRRIFESRAQGTKELVEALAAAERPPQLFLCASGINFYGYRVDGIVDESSPLGDGFLAKVCEAWEAATRPLAKVTRVVTLRIGVVLASDGGTLGAMLPIFRLGLGGPVGGGEGHLSWITIGDLARVIDSLINSESLSGPVNLVAPEPVTGRAFAKALGAAIGRPAAIPVPAWLVRTLMGEVAEETVLGSVRAVPRRLLDDGFQFQHPTIEEALASCVRK